MSRNYIDEKVTIWRRYHFKNDSDMDKVKSIIETEKTIVNTLDDTLGFNEEETLYETECSISVLEENQGEPTIEIYENGKQIWNNGESS